MKTKLLYKLSIFLFMLPMLAFTNNDWDGRYTKSKTIKKEFNVSSSATVKIDNSYGNLDVVTWDENRVVMEITITTNGNNEEKVQDKLDEKTEIQK